VPEGSVLGPYLYLIYVNDIFNVCTSVKCVLFADDTTILVSCDNIDSLINLSTSIFTNFSIWFTDNQLALNCKKTNFMLFSFRHVHVPNVIEFDGYIVLRVLSVRYLGFIIDCNLSWKEHILYVNEKVAKGLGLIRIGCKFLPKKCLLAMYYSFVYPYLIYGLEFWGFVGKSILSSTKVLQNRCIRAICRADFYAHVPPLANNIQVILFDDLPTFCTANLMFRIHARLCCPLLMHLFTTAHDIHRYSTRFSYVNFFVKPCRINVRKRFITNNGATLWNNLPTKLRQCNSLSIFKSMFKLNILSRYQ
jgi:hypothetical protein